MSSKIGNLSELENVLCNNESIHAGVLKLISAFKIGQFLCLFDGAKKQGWRISRMLVSLLLFRLSGKSLYKSHRSLFFLPIIDDNAFYRMMNNSRLNWRGLLYCFAKQFRKHVKAKGEPVTGLSCFVLDDTDLNKTGKTFEFMGRVFNHVTKQYLLGFKLLLVGYWDGKSIIPVDFSLHREEGKKGNFGLSPKEHRGKFNKKRDSNSHGAKRAKELDESKIKVALAMIKRAVKHGFVANYVLMDSWFVNDPIIKGVRSIKNGALHLLGMCKIDNRKYLFEGKELNVKELATRYERKKGRYSRKFKSRYIPLIVDYKGTKVKLFLVKYNNAKKWTLLLTTDLVLDFVKTIECYQIRWTIEVLFKECKQYLRLGQSQNTDFDGQVADATLVLITHLMLTLNKRFESYETMGELYREVQQTMLELTLYERLLHILAKIVLVLIDVFGIDMEEGMAKMVNDDRVNRKLLSVLSELDNTPDKHKKRHSFGIVAA